MRDVSPADSVRVARTGHGPGMGTVEVSELLGMGAGDEAQLTTLTREEVIMVPRTTHLTLVDLPVPCVTVTTGNGVGGTLIYTFPSGFTKRLGCRAVLSARVATANEADFTDGAVAGDFGIGTLAPANADALGTDATDDDWGTAVAFLMAAFVDASIIVASEADGVHDGTSTAVPLFLNLLVDAAEQDDDNTSEILVSGDIWFSWLNQGGA